ncbi:hypothetical protein D915_002069 [Fasciola hepatica]|uniref:Uncharacterized protein n=1 Tax=Fasciola hepatica TaxID=6192 RepID=A0A4E0RI53_FASHE|nr:hypothetical protein D915_002069 [Fasciola hepatica]
MNQCNAQSIPERAVSIPSLIHCTRPVAFPTCSSPTSDHVQPTIPQKLPTYHITSKPRLSRSFSCDTIPSERLVLEMTTNQNASNPFTSGKFGIEASACPSSNYGSTHYKITPTSDFPHTAAQSQFFSLGDHCSSPVKLAGGGDSFYLNKPPVQNYVNNHAHTVLHPELGFSPASAMKPHAIPFPSNTMIDTETHFKWPKHLSFPRYVTSVFENGQRHLIDSQAVGIPNHTPVNQIINLIPNPPIGFPENYMQGTECIMQFQPKILSRVSSVLIPTSHDVEFGCQQHLPKTPKKTAADSLPSPKSNGIVEKRLRSMSQTDIRKKHVKTKIDIQSVQNGIMYPRQPGDVFKHRFFVKDSCGLEKVLSDPTDRRIRAICDKFQCDLEVYSKVPKNGYLQYVIDISSPSLCALNSCTRALDSSLNWCLSPQLPSTLSAGSLNK